VTTGAVDLTPTSGTVGAEHALYRKNGTWFHLLERFPGALFDADGFIPFESYEDFKKFRQRPGVTGHGEIAVQGGISSHPDYIRVR
jgi:5-methylcytosine-specific restriction enzyme A